MSAESTTIIWDNKTYNVVVWDIDFPNGKLGKIKFEKAHGVNIWKAWLRVESYIDSDAQFYPPCIEGRGTTLQAALDDLYDEMNKMSDFITKVQNNPAME